MLEGIEATFCTVGDGPALRESLLPAEVLRLPRELARVDALLDDPAFFAPFALYFHPPIGRPSTPVECYLRLMYLKFRYRLGYESLCALGVRYVVISCKGKPGKARQAAERRPAFRRAVKWRTGSEGPISTLKRAYARDRARLDGTEGARTWTGYGVLAHNPVKISVLAAPGMPRPAT